MGNLCAVEMAMGSFVYGNGKGANCFKNIVRMIKVQPLDVFGILFFLLLSLRVDGIVSLKCGNKIVLSLILIILLLCQNIVH